MTNLGPSLAFIGLPFAFMTGLRAFRLERGSFLAKLAMGLVLSQAATIAYLIAVG